jgi:hypothetical protein
MASFLANPWRIYLLLGRKAQLAARLPAYGEQANMNKLYKKAK